MTYVGIQLDVPDGEIGLYATRQQTVSQHQIRIRRYLELRSFEEEEQSELRTFLFTECCRLEETAQLRTLARQFLRDRKILEPATSTLDRVIGEQRRRARASLFDRLLQMLPHDAPLTSSSEVRSVIRAKRTHLEWPIIIDGLAPVFKNGRQAPHHPTPPATIK